MVVHTDKITDTVARMPVDEVFATVGSLAELSWWKRIGCDSVEIATVNHDDATDGARNDCRLEVIDLKPID